MRTRLLLLTASAVLIGLGLVFSGAGVASAQDEPLLPPLTTAPITAPPTTTVAPTTTTTSPERYSCPGWNPNLVITPSLGETCPVTTTTGPPPPEWRFCLGYANKFAFRDPCPKPPVDLCAIHPELWDCKDPNRAPAVPDVPHDDQPSSSGPGEAVPTPVSDDAASSANVAQTGTQRRSGPSRSIQRSHGPTTAELLAFFEWMDVHCAPSFSLVPGWSA
jgi:hypothetical protein